jgi:hypothetical protein
MWPPAGRFRVMVKPTVGATRRIAPTASLECGDVSPLSAGATRRACPGSDQPAGPLTFTLSPVPGGEGRVRGVILREKEIQIP